MFEDFLDMTGYEPKTTFWDDFGIADKFGLDAVRDTYRRCFTEWKGNYVYLTELVMVLNWKIWEHHYAGRSDLAKLYDSLWDECCAYAEENLGEDELRYFYNVTD